VAALHVRCFVFAQYQICLTHNAPLVDVLWIHRYQMRDNHIALAEHLTSPCSDGSEALAIMARKVEQHPTGATIQTGNTLCRTVENDLILSRDETATFGNETHGVFAVEKIWENFTAIDP
jgi:hypothetical protein